MFKAMTREARLDTEQPGHSVALPYREPIWRISVTSASTQLSRVDEVDLTFCTYSVAGGGSVLIESESESAYMLCLGLEGSTKLLSENRVAIVCPRQLDFRPMETRLSLSSKLGGAGVFLLLSAQLLHKRIRKLGKRCDMPILRSSTLPLDGPTSSPAAKLIADCLSGVGDEIGRTENLTHPARTFELVLMLLMEALRERLATCDSDDSTIAPWYVGAIERHLTNAISEPVSVRDLARLVGLSPRTLHEGFRRYRGCSPMRFLRDKRMHFIHQELSSPESRTTVTDAALKWGFNHLGRFSAYYAEQFGEKPSETLRQARERVPSKCPGQAYMHQSAAAG